MKFNAKDAIQFHQQNNNQLQQNTQLEDMACALLCHPPERLDDPWSQSYQTLFLRKQIIFPFFATKLGRCTVHTFFSYATNSQA